MSAVHTAASFNLTDRSGIANLLVGPKAKCRSILASRPASNPVPPASTSTRPPPPPPPAPRPPPPPPPRRPRHYLTGHGPIREAAMDEVMVETSRIRTHCF